MHYSFLQVVVSYLEDGEHHNEEHPKRYLRYALNVFNVINKTFSFKKPSPSLRQ